MRNFIHALPLLLISVPESYGQALPSLPIGMNIHGHTYYGPPIFVDAMKSASDWISFHAVGESPWDTQLADSLPKDTNGYPLEIPYAVTSGGRPQALRCLINNFLSGEYAVIHDGDGEITAGGVASARRNGLLYLTLTGQGGHAWINIIRSAKSDPIRAIRILPVALAAASNPPVFLPAFVEGLKPFHALRFMDWMSINGSTQKSWSDRVRPTYYSQATSKGIAIEYALDLANLLQADPWFCVPHQADDGYIREFAVLAKARLHPSRKVYVEHSNEIWNFGFAQAKWIIDNAPGAADSLAAALAAVGRKHCAGAACHPEKDAYMMARTFRLWRSVYAGADSVRMIRVAAVQHAWMDNTRRILAWLFQEGQGADAVSPAAYFNFEERHHLAWMAMSPSAVTAKMVIDSVNAVFDSTSGAWTRGTARWAREYGVDFLVYEGGQHMQPYNQGEHPYNDAVWDAQIHPGMYDLYMRNFREHAKPEVDCRLFMAFSYVSARKSRYGSWGHLEDYAALASPANLRTVAPKYAALLDANAPGRSLPGARVPPPARSGDGLVGQVLGGRLSLDWTSTSRLPAAFRILSQQGRVIASRPGRRSAQGWLATVRVAGWPRGVYLVEARSGDLRSSAKILIP